jgi:prepilin-type N-terminal cleavage/methylation domain-containing protein
MRRPQDGFTLIEVLVVMAIIATLAGLVSLLVVDTRRKGERLVCTEQVRDLTGLLESADATRYPRHAGPNLILYLVVKGQIAGKDTLEKLFCPGDQEESLEDAGGVEAYASLDLSLRAEYGHLTSYAARDQTKPETRAPRGAMPPVVLIADDSEDHHQGKGIVVGLTGGAAKWRDKVDDYGMRKDEPLTIGPDSAVDELTCLRVE